MTENGRGEERKINGEQAMPILVAYREGKLKQNLWKMDGSLTLSTRDHFFLEFA
jgi:vacuolar-type H+-ATPase subunit B/Vma2